MLEEVVAETNGSREGEWNSGAELMEPGLL